MWIPNVISQVPFQMPMMAKLYLNGRVKKEWDGGTLITRPSQIARMEDLAQDVTAESQLTGGRKTLLETPSFRWKKFQLPITFSDEEATMNSGPNRVIDFSKYLVEKGFEGTRIHLYELMYNSAGSAGDADASADESTDTNKKFQSVIQTLDHGDSTSDIGYAYGNITRDISAGTNDAFQSADIEDGFAGSGTTSNQDTEITASLSNFRKAVGVVRRNAEPRDQFLCEVGPTLYQAFQSIVQAGLTTNTTVSQRGGLVNYGFNSFTLDGIEIVENPYLRNSNISNSHKWFFLYDINTWEMRFKPGNMFRLTDFFDQSVIREGYMLHLARIWCEGNFMCWAPNRNLWLSNMVVG